MIKYPKWEQKELLQLAHTLFYINGDERYNFKEFINAELSRLDRENRREGDTVAFHQRQGACQVLQNLVEMLETADQMYDTLKMQEKRERLFVPESGAVVGPGFS